MEARPSPPYRLAVDGQFGINDLICQRYAGFKHPLDPALLDLPWWLREAIYMKAAMESIREKPPPTCLIKNMGDFQDWLKRAREREERQRRHA